MFPPLVSTENAPLVTTFPKNETGPFSTSNIPVPAACVYVPDPKVTPAPKS